jgi:predicted metal-binding transcription factor (methanogenesis marker protein 9)
MKDESLCVSKKESNKLFIEIGLSIHHLRRLLKKLPKEQSALSRMHLSDISYLVWQGLLDEEIMSFNDDKKETFEECEKEEYTEEAVLASINDLTDTLRVFMESFVSGNFRTQEKP